MPDYDVICFGSGAECLEAIQQVQPDASLLIRRMPEYEDKAGRYRDYLASLMNGVETRMQSLKAEMSLRTRQESLVSSALSDTHIALDETLQGI